MLRYAQRMDATTSTGSRSGVITAHNSRTTAQPAPTAAGDRSPHTSHTRPLSPHQHPPAHTHSANTNMSEPQSKAIPTSSQQSPNRSKSSLLNITYATAKHTEQFELLCASGPKQGYGMKLSFQGSSQGATVYHVLDVNNLHDKHVVNIALWSPNLYILNMPTESEPRCAWG